VNSPFKEKRIIGYLPFKPVDIKTTAPAITREQNNKLLGSKKISLNLKKRFLLYAFLYVLLQNGGE